MNDVQIYSFGSMTGWGATGLSTRYVYSVLYKGYVYVMNYTKTGVYKINVNNSADITLIPLGFTSNFSGGSTYGYVCMYEWEGRIMGSDFIINEDDSVIRTINKNPLNRASTPLFKKGVYAFCFGSHNSSNYYLNKTCFLVTPYLATINNLPSPVNKTADKTMKIVYTITES